MSEQIDGEDARYILNSSVFKKAIERVEGYIDMVAYSCDPDDQKKAQRVILSKQLLRSIINELEGVMYEGDAHKMKIEQLEQKRSIFSRL